MCQQTNIRKRRGIMCSQHAPINTNEMRRNVINCRVQVYYEFTSFSFSVAELINDDERLADKISSADDNSSIFKGNYQCNHRQTAAAVESV